MLGKQCFLCKILYTEVKGFRKGRNKGTASGGAGCIQLYTVYSLVLNLDTFHILPADIENTIYLRIKESGSIVVGNGFHFTFIQHQSCL